MRLQEMVCDFRGVGAVFLDRAQLLGKDALHRVPVFRGMKAAGHGDSDMGFRTWASELLKS